MALNIPQTLTPIYFSTLSSTTFLPPHPFLPLDWTVQHSSDKYVWSDVYTASSCYPDMYNSLFTTHTPKFHLSLKALLKCLFFNEPSLVLWVTIIVLASAFKWHYVNAKLNHHLKLTHEWVVCPNSQQSEPVLRQRNCYHLCVFLLNKFQAMLALLLCLFQFHTQFKSMIIPRLISG